MSETLENVKWTIRFGAPGDISAIVVDAAYHRFVDEGQPFIEFKDANHKIVYTVHAHHVVDIIRGTIDNG